LSATSGIHSSKPNPVPEGFDGLKELLPQSQVPTSDGHLTFRARDGDIKTSYVSIGAWSWGDSATWQWSDDELPNVKKAWEILLSQGINFIDTAQAYGSGRSEEICGELVKGMPRDKFVMQTKYWVVPDADNIFKPTDAPVKKLKESLDRMNLDFVDIYMVHGHIHPQSIATVAKGMAECVEQGLAKAIAVANYNTDDMIKFAEELEKYNIPLCANQVEYHPLRRYPETSGLLAACKERGIVMQSYSSLAQGRLTGKYSKENPPPKSHRFSSIPMEEVEPMLEVLRSIGEKRGVPISAVSLNYNMSKGVCPVVGVRHEKMAEENSQAYGWRLTEEEVREIEKRSFEGNKTSLWQQN